MSESNRPSRLTVVGAAVGGFALAAATVAAVAMTDEEPASGNSPAPAASEQDSFGGESPATEAPAGDDETSPTPRPSATSEPSVHDDDDDGADDARRSPAGTDRQVTQDEAIAIAERALAEMGTVPPLREVDLDHDDGLTVWELEFGSDHEVEVDASTGEIVKLERYDD